MSVGIRIKEKREAMDMTQEELGRLCGTTKQTIFKYESGVVTNIPLSRLEKIADALGVSQAYLMGWEEPQEETRAETYQRIMKEEAAAQWYNSLSEEQKRLINLLSSYPAEKIESLLNFAESWMPPQTQETD